MVFSHTPWILHLSSSPRCFLKLKEGQIWRKHGLMRNTSRKASGFSCCQWEPCLHFLLHDSGGKHVGFGVTFLGLSSASQFHLISNFPAVIFRNGPRLQTSDSLFSTLPPQTQLSFSLLHNLKNIPSDQTRSLILHPFFSPRKDLRWSFFSFWNLN